MERLIKSGIESKATDIFRVTTECPFIWMDNFDKIWKKNIAFFTKPIFRGNKILCPSCQILCDETKSF